IVCLSTAYSLSFPSFSPYLSDSFHSSPIGKSTLLSLIFGLLTPESGTILLHGKDVKSSNEQIGYMLQKDHLFEWRSIYGNVTLGLELQKKRNWKTLERVDKMLKEYGLD